MFAYFISHMEPKSIKEALSDPNWIEVMQKELNHFETNEVWELVPSKTKISKHHWHQVGILKQDE